MFDKNIEDLVREYVTFNHGLNSKGWNRTFCEVCGDGSRTKGPRGGWLFSGEMCFYHCFNCGIDGNFDSDREHPFSKEMVKIFDGFNIPSKEYFAIAYSKKVLEENGKKEKKPERKKTVVESFDIPDFFVNLEDVSKENIYAKLAYEELKRRNIDPQSYPFYMSSGKSKAGPRDEAIAKAFMGRLIIPFFDADANLIYYQGLDLSKQSKKKYLNADVPRTNVISGMERLTMNTQSPLYVTEGFFDAYHLKGVSIQENSLTQGQIDLLKRSPRRKVFVPDKKSDSSKVVDQFIKLGWEVTVPDIGSSCKDIDDAVRKYGKLYTLQQVSSNIHRADDAKILLKLSGYLIK
jgi:hypothetical protein